MDKIDKDVVDDIVGLIEEGGPAEQVAGVILGRLGYEVDKSPLPDITSGEWKVQNENMYVFGHRITDSDDETIAQTFQCKADAKLIAAAPKLMEALYELYQEVLKESSKRAVVWQAHLDNSEEALRDAGVKL